MTTNVVLSADVLQRRLDLTAEIKTHAAAARARVGGYGPRVKHAVECGKALQVLKGLLEPGAWNRWVQQECGLNRMAANRYLRLARGADRLTPYMTVREAYIAAGVIAPKKPQSQASAQP